MRRAGVSVFSLAAFALSLRAAERLPNIVVILADDMGFSDLSCYGGEIPTPHLDRLAANGLRFTQFYNTARCCPSRAALLTGLYQHQAGVGHMHEDKGVSGYRGFLNDRCVTIAEVLRPAGYFTAMTGKWHVGSAPAHWPLQRGFDRFYGSVLGGYYFRPPRGREVIENNQVLYTSEKPPPADWYSTDAWTDHGIGFIDEALASESVRFSQGYVSHPVCSPSRAGFLTGRYQQRFGHEDNPKYNPQDEKSGLPKDQITIADVLRQAGYATGAVGKWHLGAAPGFHPNARGFTEYYGFIGGGHNYMKRIPGSVEYTLPLVRNREPVDETEYLTDAFGREAVAFIERHRRERFFLYLAFSEPHGPIQAPPAKYMDRFPGVPERERRIYNAKVSALNDAVGRVLATLRENNLESTTLVFFLSDNGGRRVILGSSNGPLRDFKESVFEGGIRVPFLMRWPGTLPAGEVYEKPVIALDIFATAAAVAGATVPADRKMDGVDLLPYLRGEKKDAPHDRLFWRTGGGKIYAAREGDYKLVKETVSDSPLLFDLANDPGETRDLAGEQPEIVRNLTAVYQGWNAELIPPVFTFRPAEPGEK